PEGQKNAFLAQAILQAEDAGYLERLIRQTIREELREVQCPGTGKTEGRPEEIPAQMLDFLSNMEDGM
ncbi:plasmid segregation centromere-binding protein ParR, partial [Faecalimonas umbilicata]|nr:plasmid segregation centromere-binding protein ParR [Faecalimonas umbilicata]